MPKTAKKATLKPDSLVMTVRQRLQEIDTEITFVTAYLDVFGEISRLGKMALDQRFFQEQSRLDDLKKEAKILNAQPPDSKWLHCLVKKMQEGLC